MSDDTCAFEECERSYYSRGYCSKHYQWIRKHQPERLAPISTPTAVCTVEGCTEAYKAKGYCNRHYDTHRYHGDALAPTQKRYYTPQESFAAHTEWDGDCLVWTAFRYSNGYGSISIGNGNEQLVHRWAWEQENGPIPDGLEIDHRCHNRACCALPHLRLATTKKNRENQQGAYKSNKSSGMRGVSWDKSRSKWLAYVGHNGKIKNLGRYETVEEAADAAKQGRLKYFTYNDIDRIV